MERKYKKLLKCMVLDAIGMASAALPVVITFIEEILPVTDVIPSFTIFWFLFDFLGVGEKAKTANSPVDTDFIEIN